MNIKLVMNRAQRENLKRLLEENEVSLGYPPGHVALIFDAISVRAQEDKTL